MAGKGSTSLGERFATLCAVLALVAQVIVPPGFMVARSGDAPTIVVCTGHGPWMAMPEEASRPGKARPSDQNHSCVFAGHGAIAPPPAVLAPAHAQMDYGVTPGAPIRDLRPGRGLAAPPPPSRGPPDLSI
jgi:hypothetical protein